MKIQRGLKAPKRRNTGRPKTYDLASLKVGDSFVVPTDKWPSLRSVASRYRRTTGASLVLEAHSIGGLPFHRSKKLRVWRVA